MSKQLPMTPELEAQIRASVNDANMDVSKLAVFESRTLSTKPIKKYGLFNGAKVSPGTLQQMADLVTAVGGAIPMQIMHNTEVLPVGRVFSGTLNNMPTGDVELISRFYIPTEKTQLVNDINNSVIDEVSVGLLTEHAFCSECNFDYFGEEADIMNRINLTCNEGHTIGEKGVHVNLVGVASWSELSLVNRGAAKDAKILSRARINMNADAIKKLAASTVPLESRFLTESTKMDTINLKETNTMDEKVFGMLTANANELATVKLELSTKDTALTAVTNEKTALEAKLKSTEEELTALKASAPEQATLLAAAKETNEKLTASVEKLLPHVNAALVASGEVETDLKDKDFSSLLELVESKGLKLHQVFGVAKTDGTKTDETKTAEFSEHRKEAFKTSKPTR